MGYLSDVFRAIPGGAGIAGVNVAVADGGGQFATPSTDSGGLWTLQFNGNPHDLITWSATDAGQTRKGSSQAAPVAGSFSLAELPLALAAIPDGIIDGYANELALSQGTGLTVTVATGAAILVGIPFVNYSAESNVNLAIAAPGSNARIDRIYLKVRRPGQTDEGKFSYGVVTGTPAASPVAPSLPANDAANAYLSLGTVRVNSGGSSFAAITSETARALQGSVERSARSVARKDRTSTANVTVSSTTPTDITELVFTQADFSPALDPTRRYDIWIAAWVLGSSSSGNTGLSLAPYATIGGSQRIAGYVDNRQTNDLGILNVLGGLTVSDGLISGGVLVKRTGNNNNTHYSVAWLEATAVPRS
jgi:hypothetical protein